MAHSMFLYNDDGSEHEFGATSAPEELVKLCGCPPLLGVQAEEPPEHMHYSCIVALDGGGLLHAAQPRVVLRLRYTASRGWETIEQHVIGKGLQSVKQAPSAQHATSMPSPCSHSRSV